MNKHARSGVRSGGRRGSDFRPTLDAVPLKFHSQWIHASFEDVELTLERGQIVVVSDSWLERENTGSNEPGKRFESKSDAKNYPAGRRPKLATFKGHAARFAVSAKTASATELATAIHPLEIDR